MKIIKIVIIKIMEKLVQRFRDEVDLIVPIWPDIPEYFSIRSNVGILMSSFSKDIYIRISSLLTIWTDLKLEIEQQGGEN